MLKRITLLAVVGVVAAFGFSGTASAGTCSVGITDNYFSGTYMAFQAQLVCTVYPPDRVDKVQFYGADSGTNDAYFMDNTHGWGMPSYQPTNSPIKAPGANGLVLQEFSRPKWCSGSFSGYGYYNYRIHQLATNSWGPIHTVTAAAKLYNCG